MDNGFVKANTISVTDNYYLLLLITTNNSKSDQQQLKLTSD